jgi:Bacterial capsule synthesis protein PGA_cap
MFEIGRELRCADDAHWEQYDPRLRRRRNARANTADALRAHGSSFLWDGASPLLDRPSWLLVNLECALTVHHDRGPKTTPVFFFRAPPELGVAALRAAQVSCVNLANNHVLDFGITGLLETIAALDDAGIAHVGAGANLAAASAARLLSLGGLRLAVLGFTDNEPGWAASRTRPGVHYVPLEPRTSAFWALLERVAMAREQADLVIVSAHWGPNMRERPRTAARRTARLLVEAGAGLVHGHSAHIVQGVELVEGQPVLYDCGGLVDDYAVDPVLRNDWSFLFLLDRDRPEAARGAAPARRLPHARRAVRRRADDVRSFARTLSGPRDRSLHGSRGGGHSPA